MSGRGKPNELGEFLKARRAELSPRAVGLGGGSGSRRVQGLRREEVALLAHISPDYYTRIEQGRIQASAGVLGALADVLQLKDEERGYLLELAGKTPTTPRRRAAQRVQPQLLRLLDDLHTTPAVVLGRRMDVLAWNPLAARLITDFGSIPRNKRNFVRLMFTDPQMRVLYPEWKAVAHMTVAQLRREAAQDPQDAGLAALVGELSLQDDDFRQWWAAYHVADRNVGTKVYRHAVVGELSLDWDTLTCTTDPDQQLIVWTAEPGSASHDALVLLASWAATERERAADPANASDREG